MAGHGSKLGRKQEQAIAALLTAKNQDEAAKAAGVSPATLQRWLRLPEFAEAFREARFKSFQISLARLEQASGAAVTTLLKIMVDPAASLSARARCAYYILEQTRRGVEVEDIEARVAKLEAAAADTTQIP
jgi:hypothetical protein